MKRILSIDGGGIRGVLPACALVALEQQLGKPVRECFDLIAGTSTGALIAAAVAAGVPATRILAIYTERSHEIFHPGQPIADFKRLTDGFIYDPANVHKVLWSEFGANAAWSLNEAPIRLLLTAKGLDSHPWYFVRDNPRNAGSTGKLNIVDCATASAAAPTYFSPVTMTIAGKAVKLVDGGVGVTGNPVYQACVEAFYYDLFDPGQTRVISLGTGYYPAGTAEPHGLLGWTQWAVDALLNAPEEQQTELVKRHWPGILQRLDWQLPRAIGLADTSAIPELVNLGQYGAAGLNWSRILG